MNPSAPVFDLTLHERDEEPRVPEVGVDLFDEPQAAPRPTPPMFVPPPAPTRPVASSTLAHLRRNCTEQPHSPRGSADPFERFLRDNEVTANGMAPGAEPTVRVLNPMGHAERAGEREPSADDSEVAWWLEPSVPPTYAPMLSAVERESLTAPRRRKPSGGMVAFSLGAGALAGLAVLVAYSLTEPQQPTEGLVAPLPPPLAFRTLAVAEPQERAERQAAREQTPDEARPPSAAPAVVARKAPAASRRAPSSSGQVESGADAIEAAFNGDAHHTASAAEPEPQPTAVKEQQGEPEPGDLSSSPPLSDELKRPAF